MGFELRIDIRGDAEPMPEDFEEKWSGASAFFGCMQSVPHTSIPHRSDYSGDPDSIRPIDFAALRQAMKEHVESNFQEGRIFHLIVDYMERNPNAYLSFSA